MLVRLRASAGTSSIKFRLGRKVGDSTVTKSNGCDTPGQNRRKSESSEPTNRSANGSNQSFHTHGLSGATRYASDHQAGKTGGARIPFAG